MSKQPLASSGRAQTIVYAAPKAPQKKQHGARRTKLLPNEPQKQQRSATSAVLLGYARVSTAEQSLDLQSDTDVPERSL